MKEPMDFSLPRGRKPARFDRLYHQVALYEALLRAYTRPLFSWRKALARSHDGRTLYDFARHTTANAEALHRALTSNTFRFREGIALRYNFNGKKRTIYLFPWEERIVDLLLYRMLNRCFHSAFSSHSYAYRFRNFGVDPCQRGIRRALAQLGSPVYAFKRDIADYFDSIDHDILLDALRKWVDPDDYLFDLIEQRVRFRYREAIDHDDERTGVVTAQRGVAFGTAIACFLANLYLTPVDRLMDDMSSLHYFRYGDDVLALSADRQVTSEALARFDAGIAALKLSDKPSHHHNFVLTANGTGRAGEMQGLAAVTKFRHLGLEFRADGSTGLPRDKFRKIRNLFRFAFRRARRRFRRILAPEKRAALAIDISRDVIERGFRSVAIIDYYLKHVDDEQQIRLLDRWLAEEILALAFNNGHKKSNFRRLPFGRLRAMGLPSLRHRRRLIRHGHLVSSFFVMRTEKLIEVERGRLPDRPPRSRRGEPAFSPSPEAAAKEPS